MAAFTIPPPDDEEDQDDPLKYIRRPAEGKAAQTIPMPTTEKDIPAEVPTEQPELAAQPGAHNTDGVVQTGRKSGIAGTVDPQTGHYIQPNPVSEGVASLWHKSDNIHNAPLRILAKIGAVGARAADTIGSIAAPGAAAMIPGSTLNEAFKNKAAQESETADSENAQREAQAGEEKELTAEAPEKLKIEQDREANAENPKQKDAGQTVTTDKGVMQWNPQTQRYDIPVGGAPAKPQNDFEQFYKDYITENNLPDSAHNRLLARKEFAQAGQKPPEPLRQMVVTPDGKTVEVTPGMTLPAGSKTMAGDLAGNKPNAEELKRSEMAENMNENLDKLADIVKRRPELFGKVAGRETQLRMWVGSNDPDIAALKTIHDQMGMAQQSAHSMRSAQHVDAAANSILNSFVNGPDAINSSIKTARDSLKTFTHDVQEGNPSVRGNKTQGKDNNDPLGIR